MIRRIAQSETRRVASRPRAGLSRAAVSCALVLLLAATPGRAQSTPSSLAMSSYLGGSGADAATAVAVDALGFVWVVGRTAASDFPTSGQRPGARSGPGDVFVVRIDARTRAVSFAMLVGGSGDEEPLGVAVDAGGNAYVTGWTTSLDFPTTEGAFDRTNGRVPNCVGADCIDAFAFKVPAAGGELAYSTFLGGEHQDYGYGISVTPGGEAVVVGWTASFGWPVKDAFSPRKQPGFEGAIAKLSADGRALVYGSYIGGSGGDAARAVALTPGGSAVVVGSTTSTDFPTKDAFQPGNAGGGSSSGDLDAFVLEVSTVGALVFSSYLGGRGPDAATAVAIASDGSIFVAGESTSDDFPTRSAFQAARAGGADAFVAKLAEDGGTLVSSSYLGGAADDAALAIAALGNDAVVAGVTRSTDLPTSAGWQPACGSCAAPAFAPDGFVARVAGESGALRMLSYLGGRSEDRIAGVAVSSDARIVVAGSTFSSDFPLVDAFQSTCRCGVGTDQSAFVTWTDAPVVADPTIVITSVRALKRPFRLEIEGEAFAPGSRVLVGGREVVDVEVVSETLIRAGGGKSLKALLPKGVPVTIEVSHPERLPGRFTFTR